MKKFKYLLAGAKIRLSNSSKVIVFYCPSGFLSAKFMCTVLSIFLGHEQMCSEKFAEMVSPNAPNTFEFNLSPTTDWMISFVRMAQRLDRTSMSVLKCASI